jgi:hypothetical protein
LRLWVLISLKIGYSVRKDGDIFAGAPDHGVAEVTEQSTNFACLVIVIYYKLFFIDTADGAFAALACVH